MLIIIGILITAVVFLIGIILITKNKVVCKHCKKEFSYVESDIDSVKTDKVSGSIITTGIVSSVDMHPVYEDYVECPYCGELVKVNRQSTGWKLLAVCIGLVWAVIGIIYLVMMF